MFQSRRVLVFLVMAFTTTVAAAAALAGTNAGSKLVSPVQCAPMTMDASQAQIKHNIVILTSVSEMVNGKPRNVRGPGWPLYQFNGSHKRFVGYTHPDCWTVPEGNVDPIDLSQPDHRPNLCIGLYFPDSSTWEIAKADPNDPKSAACPTPHLHVNGGTLFLEYEFMLVSKVVLPPPPTTQVTTP